MILRKIGVVLAGGTLAASLAACDFSATGTLECRTAADGKVVCTASGVGTPTAPTTPPPTTTPPPADPNAGLPAAALSAAPAGDGRVRVSWTTQRTDITGWRVGRNGTDTSGTGAWSTDLPAPTRDITFGLLRPGVGYTFTVVGRTAAGALAAVSVTATAPGPAPQPDPDPGPDPDPVPSGTTAAERHGWGAPIAAGSDEFNYVGAPGPKWNQAGECWPGNRTVVQGRCASRTTVDGNKMVLDGRADGKAPWVAAKFGQQYGRWEARVRSYHTGANNGRTWHPLLIIWPDSNRFPDHGEYDFLENGAPGEACAESFMHYPGHTPKIQEFSRETNCGAPLSEWHNVAFEWTPQHVRGFIDGKQWFSHGLHDMTAMPSGHLTVQFDNFTGTNMSPARYEVDWVRAYPLR